MVTRLVLSRSSPSSIKTSTPQPLSSPLGHVVVEAVAVDKDPCGSPAEEGPPPPLVVLHCKLEVGQRDGNEGRDDDENHVDNEEDGPDDVDLGKKKAFEAM